MNHSLATKVVACAASIAALSVVSGCYRDRRRDPPPRETVVVHEDHHEEHHEDHHDR